MHQVVRSHWPAVVGLIVWIHMLPGDGIEAAWRQAAELEDPSLRQFHDPRRRTGKALATRIGAGRGVVWDTYMFFPAGVRWGEDPPAPEDWAHQLDAPWADPARFRWEHDLVRWLENGAAPT